MIYPSKINYLSVYALPVAVCTVTVIQCPNGNIVLMDCGSSSVVDNLYYADDVQQVLGKQLKNVFANLVITHPDRDHFNYMYIPSIKWNNVQSVIIGGKPQDYNYGNNNQFNDIYRFLEDAQKNNRLHMVNGGQSCIGDCNFDQYWCGTNSKIQFQILAANVGRTSNQKSIVMRIVHGQWSMLLSGDMEGAAATKIAKTLGNKLQSTVYKMSHHGASSQANKKTWLAQIRPVAAFASSAYNFGNNRHPRCDAIIRLLTFGTIVKAQKSHTLYCGNKGAGAAPTIFNDYEGHIYETSPSEDEMSVLAYNSNSGFEEIRILTLAKKRQALRRRMLALLAN